MIKDDEHFSWVRAAKAASIRFTMGLEEKGLSWAVEIVQSQGHEAAAARLKECSGLPASLRQLSSAIVQAPFLESMDGKITGDDTVPGLTKLVREYVTLKTLDMRQVGLLFPQHIEKVKSFLKAVSDEVVGRLQRTVKESDEAKSLVSKYRSGMMRELFGLPCKGFWITSSTCLRKLMF